MAEIRKYGSTKRFGARYGRKLKERFGKIEREQRKKQKCPYCSAIKVKRIAVGIWECGKCDAKFTGKAYTVSKKGLTNEEVVDEKEVA
ncbi:MAG: 50S ribosomal protein L37ae [Nanoarchaeota archaeon]|nr:50S ribosomal protein L37ae [Nanoarchaeota archaeon]